MAQQYTLSLFIFRRDLRIQDNTGLNNALEKSNLVIPCFIFDPRQIDDENKYKSDNAIQFMCESLAELDAQLRKHGTKLYLVHGKAEEVIKKLITSEKIDAIFMNRDYTSFSIKRDTAIAKLCKQQDVAFEYYGDALLNEPEAVLKKDNSHYSIFTPFYKKAIIIPVKEPQALHKGNWFSGTIKTSENLAILKKIALVQNKEIVCHGGSSQALTILKNIECLKNYKRDHDYPNLNTSHLSAYLKFGTVSPRQVYYAVLKHLGRSHPLLRQLYWRDFFSHIVFHVPSVFGHAYHKKYDHLKWNYDKKLFKQWCDGKTGFPIVDAGMRELNTTGFMHNRVRMIVASFLVKDLHIDWLWGERYFAQQLVDYDPAINNGNWQWCASTGCDAQPYFRIFNPWLQQKKYDPECLYIKQWVPELKSFDNKIIHNLFKKNSPHIEGYPKPIVDHAQESALAKKLYRNV
jgi:deoxyribodipyrimidine photo-lyase